jgi:hypothetical protein
VSPSSVYHNFGEILLGLALLAAVPNSCLTIVCQRHHLQPDPTPAAWTVLIPIHDDLFIIPTNLTNAHIIPATLPNAQTPSTNDCGCFEFIFTRVMSNRD